MSERRSKKQINRVGSSTVFLCSQPVKIKLSAESWLLAEHHIKLMDQRAEAQHMKPIHFKGVSALSLQPRRRVHTRTHANTFAHNIKLKRTCACWRHFYIQPTRGTTEMGENGPSIIISREEQRWRRKKATVLSARCRDNKIRPCVIHLWPWRSAPHPPTTLSVGWCTHPLFLAFLCLLSPKSLFWELCI